MGFLGWFLAMLGTVGFLLARPSVAACESGVDLARTIGTANPQQTCTYWQWGWESIREVVGVRPSSGFGARNSSLALNSLTVGRSVAVALVREDAAGQADGTFQAWASIPRGGARQGWRADRSRAAGSRAREQVDIRFQQSDLGLADPG